MESLVDKDEYLLLNELLNGEPMKLSEGECDVLPGPGVGKVH